MGKKGSWFSAIKRVFTNNSKEKRADGPDKKSSSKEKKKGKGILRHGDTKSFIPLFREPSSIEKILGEADQLLIRPPPTSSQRPKSPPALPVRPVSPRPASPDPASHRASSPKSNSPKAPSPKSSSPRAPSPRVASPRAAPRETLSTGAIPPKAAPRETLSTGAVPPKAAPRETLSTGAAISPKAAPPTAFSSGAASSKAAAPKSTQSRKEIRHVQKPEPTLRDQQLSATKIQAAYRGYLARRSFRALKGLMRLQVVVKGQNVRRQTVNAMKQMQLLVRVQTQIQSRRIQMLENQALQDHAYKSNKDAESTLSKWTLNHMCEASQNEDWDDSRLTKEEVEARTRKRVEAVIKRERAMAYAYSNQLWKANIKSTPNSSGVRSNGFPWWWNWLERQLPQAGSSQSQAASRSISLTPSRAVSEFKPSPQLHPSSSRLGNLMFDNHESVTPRSSRSAIPVRAKYFQTTPGRSPLASSSSYIKFSKPKAGATNSAYDTPMKDDDSLVSCPPFSVPNYMTPTVSAKAKARAYSNPRERFPGTPGSSDSKRRFSFPLTPNAGSFKWNKGSNRDSASQVGTEKREDTRSIGDFSVNSTVSMPAGLVGRKPFNRFV
ncbi:protein IQ-DOMAIN 13-like [Salvia hispanica]|uniref:protein IQ-DOMAIN 13-like n=1 Tax=Salvia hispanica TaxID=49212 RepID=UPI00200932CA|nr:protein IQ-DOMAIN 13-like [Salvia hispanica]